MKAVAVTILSSLIFINSFFYCGYYDAMIIHSKNAATKAIAKAGDKNNFRLIKIPFSKKAKYAQHEIWYEHNLYDVAKKEVVNDSVYIYLYHDSDEQNILSEIADFFQPDTSNYFAEFPGISLLKSIHTIPDLQYLFPGLQLFLKTNAFFKKSFTGKHYVLTNTVSKTDIPPPRSFI